jgi:protein-S-isoprenylcysteine O-methyltransferase Ste14
MSETSKEHNGPKVKIKPPIIFAISAIIGILVQLFFKWGFTTPVHYRIILGLVIISISGIIQLNSLSIFKLNGRKPTPTLESNSLFVSGPYRYSRNPMYVSLVLLQFGMGIIINNLWLSAFSFMSLTIVHFLAVLPEEEYLKNKFGESYLNYMNSVRRYF